MAVFIVVNTKPAHAGVLSFLEDLLGIKKDATESIIANSQTIPLLEATNNLDSNAAKGGGNITIVNNNAILPDAGPMGTIADIDDFKPSQDQISIYVVRKNDSLSQIAKMFDVSVNTIKWANDIKNDQISPGQTLIILPVSGIQYTIKKGDTINSIAKKFNGDADEILQFNNITAKDITEGQIIIVPNGEDYGSQDSQKTNTAPQPIYTNNTKTNTPSYIGYYMRPIDGGRKSQGIHGYNAVDLANSCGTPIYASASGDVIISRSSGWNAGYGSYIVISHPNGTQTLYAHLSKNIVYSGWHVTKGQIIGYIGSTGKSTGCHLHFEIRNGPRNPF